MGAARLREKVAPEGMEGLGEPEGLEGPEGPEELCDLEGHEPQQAS